MSQNKIVCQTLSILPHNDELNRFVRIGEIKNSTNVFQCGTVVNGIAEVNAWIDRNGTCSFLNKDTPSSFTGLADVPHHYQDHKNDVLVVGEDENCLRFSKNLKVDDIKTISLSSKDIFANDVKVTGKTDLYHLNVEKLTVYGSAKNKLGETDIRHLSSLKIQTDQLDVNGASVLASLKVDGESQLGKVSVSSLFNKGLSHLGELKATGVYVNFIEVDGCVSAGTIDLAGGLSVSGTSFQKQIHSNVIDNAGEIKSSVVRSNFAEIDELGCSKLAVDDIKVKSIVSFGTPEKPVLFTPNEKRHLDIEFEMKGQRHHGYGFTNVQCLDTLNVKLKNVDLALHRVNVHFHYYNLRNCPIQNSFHTGTNTYALDETTAMSIVKLSNPLPSNLYWVISVEIVPF